MKEKPIGRDEITARALLIACEMLIVTGCELEGGDTSPMKVRRWLKGKARQELLKERRERREKPRTL